MKIRALVFLALAALALPSSSFAAGFGFRSMGVEAGAVSVENYDPGYTVGLKLDLGEVFEKFALIPTVQYWKVSKTKSIFEDVDVDLTATNLSLGFDVKRPIAGEDSGFYLGTGLRWNRLQFETSVSDAFGTLGVVETKVDRFGPVGLIGYDGDRFYVGGSYSLVSDFNTVRLVGGVRFGGKSEWQ